MRNFRLLRHRLAGILLLISLVPIRGVNVFLPIQKAQALDNSLIAHWTFDVAGGGIAEDETVNGHTGSLTSGVAGFLGAAPFVESNVASYTFDGGTGTYVSVPHHADFNVDNVTISAWIKLADVSQTNGAGIICKGTGGGGEVWCIDVYEGAYRFFSSSGLSGTISATSGLSTEWTHIVATYDGAFRKIYINGKLEGTVTEAGTLGSNNHEVSIGCRQESSAGYNLCLNGRIDDVKIYNGALSDEEIAGLTFGGISSYWDFESGSGTDTFDASEGSHDAVLLPDGTAPSWTTDIPPTVYNNEYALEFDGTNYVSTQTGAIIDGQDELSVSTWVKVDAYQTQRAVFSNYTPSGYGLLIETGTVNNDVLIAINDGGTNPFGMTATNVYQTGDWHLWTVVYDGNGSLNEDKLKFYIDGVEQALSFNNSIPSTVGTSAKDLTFGASLDDEERYFDGFLDEIQLFDRTLAESEIQWLALNAEVAGVEYEVEDCDDLQDVTLDLEGSYTQIANIDCSGFDFVPIGEGEAFQGQYDGNGYVISNLNIDGMGNGDGSGLFGVIGGDGEIRRVGIVSGSIVVADIAAGALAGVNNGEIAESFSKADVGGAQFVGGLVGFNEGMISDSYATGDVQGIVLDEDISAAGGMIGINLGLVINAYAIGSVRGAAVHGGFLGFSPFGAVYNVFAAGEVGDGLAEAFGIGAFQNDAILVNSIWNSELTGQEACGSDEGCTDDTDISHYAHNGLEPFATWNETGVWNIQDNDYPILLWESPVAYFRFDGSNGDNAIAQDSSYEGNNLTLRPADNLPSYDADVPSVPVFYNDWSVALNGTTQHAYRATFNDVPSSNLTICTWLKTTGADAVIAQQGRGLFDFDDEYVFKIDNGGYLTFWDYYDGEYGFPENQHSTDAVNDGAWHHACFVKEGLSGTYYVDGIESGTETAAQDSLYSENDFAIGRDIGDDQSAFGGSLDDFRVYARPLAAPEIAELVGVNGEGEVGVCSLSAYWNFEEGSGTTVFDSTENSYDGTLNGTEGIPEFSADVPSLEFDNSGSLLFDASDNQFVEFPAKSVDESFTLAAWVKIGEMGGSWGAIITDENDVGMNINYDTESGAYFLDFYDDDDDYISETSLTPGTWQHIAVVGSGGNIMLFIDGVETALSEGDGTLNITDFSFTHIGSDGNGSNFDGHIDDVRIFDTALSSGQIADLADGIDLQLCDEAIICSPDAHWSYDTVIEDVVSDDSGNGYEGDFNATLSEDVPSIGVSNSSSMEDGFTVFDTPKTVANTFSISLWVKPETFMDSWANLISEIQDSEIGLWFSGEGNGADAYKISYYNGDENGFTASALSRDQWHHIAVVNDGDEAAFYIDGVYDTAVPGFSGSIDLQMIGDSIFPGFIDDVRVYDALLTDEQIATLAAGELTCKEPEPEPQCPAMANDADASVIYLNNCYMFFNSPVSWSAANANCQGTAGGHLVTINGSTENDAVTALSTAGGAWTGANDIDVENTFVWEYGESFSYTNWAFGEPNNFEDNQDCVQIHDSGTWDDADCSGAMPYVCEAPGIEVVEENVITWEGDVSDDWYDDDNWDLESLPNDSSTVIIPATDRDPVLTSGASIENLTIGTGATLSLNGHLLQIDEETFTNYGTLAVNGDEDLVFTNDTAHGGTVLYAGSGTYDLLVLGNSYANVAFSSGSYTLSGSLTAMDLTVVSGMVNAGANDLYMGGDLRIFAEGTFMSGATVGVNEVVAISGALIAPVLLEVGNAWLNDGEFDANRGEVEFTDAETYVAGDTTFHDFTIETLGTMTLRAGDTFVIEGEMYAHGFAGHYELRSSVEGERWYIDPQGTRDVSEVMVQDSENINEEDIDCSGDLNCIDGGNNIGWMFEGDPVCGDGEVYGESEGCDDGNLINGDGCDDECSTEEGWNCGSAGGVGASTCYENCLPGTVSVQEGDRCYFFVDWEYEEWEDAREVCLYEAGGDLASITGSLLQTKLSYLADGDSGWIGFNDIDDPGTFVWVLGDAYDYSNWDSGQPNSEEHCTLMQGDGTWVTQDCDSDRPYFCSFSTVCGDGEYTFYEDCDDGNLVNGDGCSASCEQEEGYYCDTEPAETSFCRAIVCGDGYWDYTEDCDDGNLVNGDGCSLACEQEEGFVCYATDEDERAHCEPTVCGDAESEGSEDCDDGNTANGDGCSAACDIEAGYSCDGEPSECFVSCSPSASGASQTVAEDSKCFGYYSANEQWDVAKNACQMLDGRLAVIENAEENEAVQSLVSNRFDAWIGGTDGTTEATFLWVSNIVFWAATPQENMPESDGAIPDVYTNWNADEPNNYTGFNAAGEDCVEIYMDGYWNDNTCLGYRPYICEWSLTSVSSASSTSSSNASSAAPTGGGGGGGGWRPIGLITQSSRAASSAIQNLSRSSSSSSKKSASSAVKDPLEARIQGTQVTFNDISVSAWYASFVKELVELGGINGYQDAEGNNLGVFKPQNDISYAEMIKILMKVSGKEPGDIPSNLSARDTWAAPFIAGAERDNVTILRLLNDVHAPAKRWEVMTMIMEMLAIPLQETTSLSYADVRYLHPGYKAIETATRLGIVSGDDDKNTFRPDDPINRAEAAKMIVLALKQLH